MSTKQNRKNVVKQGGMVGKNPEPPVSPPSDAQARDEEVRRTDVSGDRVASRRDAEKLRSKGRP
jgi:hypothetical protein